MTATTYAVRPEVADAPAWVAPVPTVHTLDNGMVAHLYHLPGQRVISTVMVLDAGSVRDPDGMEGLADLTVQLMVQAAGALESDAFAERLAGLGADLEAFVDVPGAVLRLGVPASRLEPALALLRSAVAEPRFDRADVERQVAMTAQEMEFRVHEPQKAAMQALDEVYYPHGSRPRLPDDGCLDTVLRLTAPDVAGFHRDHVGPAGGIVVVAGDLDGIPVLDLLAGSVGTWSTAVRNPPRPALGAPAADPPGLVVLDRPGSVQSVLCYGSELAPPGTDEAHAGAAILHAMAGSPESVLWHLMRDEKGYTYGCHAPSRWLPAAGRAGVMTAVDTPWTIEACRDLLDVLADTQRRGLTAEQFATAVAELRAQAPAGAETAGQVAAMAAQYALLGLPHDHMERMIARLGTFTAESAHSCARSRHDLTRGVLVVVGDLEQIGPELARLGLGEPTVIDLTDALYAARPEAASPDPGDAMTTPYIETETAFAELTTAATPVLVDFTATWCGPCQALAPIIDEIRPQLAGRCDVRKLDVDVLPTIAESLDIQGVPTLMLFEDGEVLLRMTGASSARELLTQLDPFI